MTHAELGVIAAACRRRILDNEITITSDADRPISVDPFSEEFAFCTDKSIDFEIGGEVKTVHAGFAFDGASIPAVCWVLLFLLQFTAWLFGLKWLSRRNWCKPLNTFYKILYAACFHDWAWRYTVYGRKIGKRLSNAAFEAILVASGVDWKVARVMYYAVSLFGNRTYARYADINEKKAAKP